MQIRPFLAPLTIGLAGAAVLVWLGTWQMQRLDWKEAVLARIEARISAAPIALPKEIAPSDQNYLAVRLTGSQSEAAELHVLVSHKKFGPGFRVIAPLVTSTGRRVMVDRGFVTVEDKDSTRPPLEGALVGNLIWPDDRTSSTPENDLAANIWYARDVVQMAQVLQTEPLLIVLREAPLTAGQPRALPVGTEGIPNDHLNYAITWFSLATIWLGMTGYWLWRIRRRATSRER